MYKAGVVQNPEATNPAYHETEGATLGLTALTRYYNNPPAPDAAIASPGGYGGLGFSKRTPKDEAAFADAFGAENVARLRGGDLGPPPGPHGSAAAPPTGLNTGASHPLATSTV